MRISRIGRGARSARFAPQAATAASLSAPFSTRSSRRRARGRATAALRSAGQERRSGRAASCPRSRGSPRSAAAAACTPSPTGRRAAAVRDRSQASARRSRRDVPPLRADECLHLRGHRAGAARRDLRERERLPERRVVDDAAWLRQDERCVLRRERGVGEAEALVRAVVPALGDQRMRRCGCRAPPATAPVPGTRASRRATQSSISSRTSAPRFALYDASQRSRR